MKYLVLASQMRRYDSNTIEKIGIPACVLMERAALAAAQLVEAHCKEHKKARVLVMAGYGNNGGDGLALSRLLSEKAFRVEVWCVGDPDKASDQWRRQREILSHYPVEFVAQPKGDEYEALVDALFGVGLSRELSGIYGEAVRKFMSLAGWKLALDLPSGVDSDTGRILGCAVRADATLTFGFCKVGLMLYPGCEYAGEVEIADIGISERSFFGMPPQMYAYDEEVAALLPKRAKNGHKGTFGRLLLIAGSVNMAGAAVLAARAAYRAGAGMVKVATDAENRIILQQTVPEALLGERRQLRESLDWADVIAIGPGLGKSEEAFSCLEQVVMESRKPLLVDADGLNLLAEHPELKSALSRQGAEGRAIVLTPHIGELSRLLGESAAECGKNPALWGCELAAGFHAVVAAKDARTFVCAENQPVCVNLSGNSGMGTAGSGDVLAGVIAALLAQGMSAYKAAAVGVYVHGKAGDSVSAEIGEYSCMAGDIAQRLLQIR